MDQDRVISRDLVLANSNVLSAVAVLVILALMVIPVSPVMLDVLMTFSIALAVVVMLVSLYLQEPLQFSTFPSLLLVMTLFRLALNVASTRLILSRGQAGQVVESFGDFVIGGNYVIGVIVFVILVIVNFLVITKGSTRIAEVSARFTLDAMPGKQMAIDADLNAGLISEQQARQRREKIAGEAEFFGAMDGASKFVRGDAIAGIVITLINIGGGFVIGMAQLDMTGSEALSRFTLLTVGDGLVSQVPALLVSTAAGLVVTRSSGDLNLGQALTLQIFRQGKALDIAAGALLGMGLIPGLPTIPFLLLAGGTFAAGRTLGKRVTDAEREDAEAEAATAAEAEAPAESDGPRGEDLFVLDRLELEIGYGLIGLVDESRGGDLLQRIGNIRSQISAELGIFIHPIRVRDNLQLQAGQYVIKLKGVPVATADLRAGQLLAMSTRPDAGELAGGVPTTEPAFNLPAVWIEPERRAEAEAEGYTVVEAPAVLATHLSEVVRAHADELLSRQDIRDMLESVREFAPALIEELIPDKVPVNTLHNVLRALLHERVPVRDIVTILETIANHVGPHAGTDLLTARVREALHRSISQLYADPAGALHVVSLHPETEQAILEASRQSEQTGQVVLSPRFTQEFLGRLDQALRGAYGAGAPPVLLVPTPVRFFVKRLVETTYPNLAVMGYTEVAASVRIQSAGTVVTHGHNALEQQAVD